MMKGLVTPDLIIEELLREVLAQIQNNQSMVDDIFDQFIQSHFAEVYGKKQIDEIKTYLRKKKINVIDGYTLLETKLPAYIVHLGNANEVDAEATLDDFAQEKFSNNDEFVDSYGSILDTGALSSADGKYDTYQSSITETVIIDCVAQDHSLISRFMAALLHYVLRLNKNLLIQRGLNRISISFSDFHPLEDHNRLPEYVFRRTCMVRCQHYLCIEDNISDQLISALTVQLQAQDEGNTTDAGDEDDDIITTIE